MGGELCESAHVTNEAPDRPRLVHAMAQKRWLRVALLVAVLLRVLAFWVVTQHPERAISPDSPAYLELSRHFVEAFVAADAEYRSDSVRRTPGYPLFCHLWFRLFTDSVTSILVAQNVLSLICVGIVFVLARRMVGPEAASWAAVLVAMDPLAITYSNMIRNEVLFTVVLALGVLQWHSSLTRPHAASVAAVGLLFGLATLVRPVTTYLILFLVPADMWLRRRRAANALIGVWMIAGFLIPVGGWIARNHQLTGHAVISSIEDENLLHYRVAGAVAEENGEKRTVVAQRLLAEAARLPAGSMPSVAVAFDKSTVLRLLAQYPYGVAVSTIRGFGHLLFGPGTGSLNQLLFDKGDEGAFVISSSLAAYLLVVYLGLAVGVVCLTRQGRSEPLVLLGTIVVYTVLICSGPEGYSRFRAPLMPLFAIVAGGGFASLGDLGNVFRFSPR